MKILVLTTQYPSDDDLYRNAFVHQRAIAYFNEGDAVEVFVYKWQGTKSYSFDGINVIIGSSNELKKKIKEYKPDVLAVHFLWFKFAGCLSEIASFIPTVVWCHGIDVCAWWRRLHNIFSVKSALIFSKYVISNVIQRFVMKRFVENKKIRNRVSFVFVSNWLRETAEADIGTQFKDFSVVPNPINDQLFRYEIKKKTDRLMVAFLRPFTERKYAYDIAIAAIRMYVEKYPDTKMFFTIRGDGEHFVRYTETLKDCPKVKVIRGFMKQWKMAEFFRDNGVFLCPTRQDSHGVSMCEAMMSGLVPITTDVSAIPEYCDETCGFLSNQSPHTIVDALREIENDADKYLRMSKRAHQKIMSLCSKNVVIAKERQIMMRAIGNH